MSERFRRPTVHPCGLALSQRGAVPDTGHRLGVERIHGVAGRDQRGDPWAALGLDTDDHLRVRFQVVARIRQVLADQSM